MRISNPYLQFSIRSAGTWLSASLIGVHPLAGILVGSASYFSGRAINWAQNQTPFAHDPLDHNIVQITKFAARFFLNSSLLYFAANAVGFSITFQTMLLLRCVAF